MDDPAVYRAARAAFNDAEQARILAVVTLYADMDLERVLRGPRRGQDLGDALEDTLCELESHFDQVDVRFAVVRPWWNAFRPVRRLSLIPADVQT